MALVMHLLMQHLRWTLAMNSAEFTQKNVELAVTVYPGMFTDANCWRIQSTKPERCWHLRLQKHWRCQLRRWDAYNWPRHFGRFSWFTTKKPVDWTSSWVSSHICSQRESLAERNIFILDFRFLSISINVVVLCVVIIIYLYLFSCINDSCMASPFIQLSKNTYFYWVICYYYAVIRNSSCHGTKKLNPWKMAVPGANFAGKRVGSKGLIYDISLSSFRFVLTRRSRWREGGREERDFE